MPKTARPKLGTTLIAVAASLCALSLVSPAIASAGPSHTCTRNAPRASIDNTWAWASPGSWGMRGQQLKYAIDVFNNDVGCGSSSFAISMSAPAGFSVSIPASTTSLNSASTGYVWAYVTSPSAIADGDYPLAVTVNRVGTSSPSAPAKSYYKVYSSDTVAPTLYWMNPSDGEALSGRTINVGVASSDNHAVKRIELYIDGTHMKTSLCDNVSYECQLSYAWSTRRVHGQHAVRFASLTWWEMSASRRRPSPSTDRNETALAGRPTGTS